MKFTLATVIAVLPFLVDATPLALAPRAAKGISIPISKRATSATSGVVDASKLRASLAHLQGKYDHTLSRFEANTGTPHPNAAIRGARKSVGAKKRATGADALTDAQEELWYGTISVGTPPVDFTIDFDSGSSDLFIPSSSCDSCGSHTTYDPSSSSTSSDVGQTFTLQYGDGSTTSGEQYTDTVTVAGLTVDSQTLGSATSYSSSFQSGPTDGLMGLAFPAISSFPATPFFNNLIQGGGLDAGQFSFFLASDGSELYLGGADADKFSGDLNWNAVTQEGYWQINLDSFTIGSKTAVSGLSVIVDSGTTLIVGDDANVKKFYAAVPGSKDASSTVGTGFYSFPCSSVPSVSATFNGVEYAISADNFNLGQVSNGSSDCVGAVVSGNEGFWILGDAFMKNVYTTFDFDNSQVGFASLA